MFKNYLKIAFRNLLKHKSYTFINIVGLALGITCCALTLAAKVSWLQGSSPTVSLQP